MPPTIDLGVDWGGGDRSEHGLCKFIVMMAYSGMARESLYYGEEEEY